jgi:HD-GYP domain-containing protein (c-di-GMP phosphodiesterase class II)
MTKEDGHLVSEMYKVIDHGISVSQLSYLIGKEIGLSDEECYELAIAGVIHDIGKLQLNSYIYDKDQVLTKEELRYVRMHSSLSYDILKDQDFSQFILDAILYHHENYDGTGYPKNLMGEDIPLSARILRVGDVFSALISDRPYRKGFDEETAIKIMIEEIKYYDLRIFMAFQKVVNEKEGFKEERLDA